MNKRNNSIDYKRRYELVRHHAWAGLGFLSVLLAIRIVYPGISELLQPLIIVVIIYIVISLLFTFRYYKGLADSKTKIVSSDDIQNVKNHFDIEKESLKLEKKRIKSAAKAEKKSNKK